GKIPIGSQTCDTAGIIQPAVSQVVVHQTTEALKILTGNHAHLRKKLVSFDLWTNQTVNMKVNRMKKGDCPSCGEHPTYPFLQFDAQTKTAVLWVEMQYKFDRLKLGIMIYNRFQKS